MIFAWHGIITENYDFESDKPLTDRLFFGQNYVLMNFTCLDME
jgi:hypothetical protein